MTRSPQLPVLVTKEIRALSFAWLACLGIMLGAAVLSAGQFRSLGIGAYFLGAATLGALSIGHEYSHRTLTLLLTLPARRERLLLAKLGVLLVMLLLLCAVAAVVLFNAGGSLLSAWPSALLAGPPRSLLQREYVLWALWLPVLGGLIVAPWLTMLFRNPIAGAVFTVAIPGMLALAGMVLGMAVYGRSAPEVDGFGLAFFRTSALGFCAIGAVMGWRTFMRLEADDRRDPEVRLPHWRWSASTTTTAPASALDRSGALRRGRRHPLWRLATKEIHLQQMSLVVAGLYVLGWLAIVLSRDFVPDKMDDVVTAFTVFFAFLVSLLNGALASAEERQLGTHEWQVVLPVVTSTQWAVKVAMALGLTMVVALGLPALLASVSLSMHMGIRVSGPDMLRLELAVPIVAFTAGSLYVSSLCGSGIQALLISVAAVPGVALFIQTVLVPLGSMVFLWASRLSGQPPWLGTTPSDLRFPTVLALLLIAGFLVVVLRFALVNHRSAERGAGRVVRQVIWMALCLVIGVTVWGGVAGSVR